MPSDAKAITHHFPPADQCAANLQTTATLEPHKHTPVLLLSMTLYGMEYFFSLFRSAVLAVCPHTLLPNPSLLCWGGRVRNRP